MKYNKKHDLSSEDYQKLIENVPSQYRNIKGGNV